VGDGGAGVLGVFGVLVFGEVGEMVAVALVTGLCQAFVASSVADAGVNMPHRMS
jgi:hypothetical protein